MPKANKRISYDNFPNNYQDGQILLAQDVNKIIDFITQGVNANKKDLDQILTGKIESFVYYNILTPPLTAGEDGDYAFIYYNDENGTEDKLLLFKKENDEWVEVDNISLLHLHERINDLNGDLSEQLLVLNGLIDELNLHKADTNNPHSVTAEQVNTYTKTVIDQKDTNTLNAAKDYTYSKVNIDGKDSDTLALAKGYTDIENSYKLDKNFSILSEQTALNLTDVLVINRDNVPYRTTVANLLANVTNTEIFKVVLVLPSNPEPADYNKIFLVPTADPEMPNYYEEWLWVDYLAGWEKLGGVTVDLSNYYTKNQTDTLLGYKQDKLTAGDGISIVGNVISATNDYDDSKITNYVFTASDLIADGLHQLDNVALQYVVDTLHPEDIITISNIKIGDSIRLRINRPDGGYTEYGVATIIGFNEDETAIEVIVKKFSGCLLNDKSQFLSIGTIIKHPDYPNNIYVNTTAGHFSLSNFEAALTANVIRRLLTNLVEADIPQLPASKITQTSSARFVTDAEKSTWNGKQNALTAGDGISIVGNVISATNEGYPPDEETITLNSNDELEVINVAIWRYE